jgi:hypothetical protein
LDAATKAAGKRLRTIVDMWIAAYGDKGFLPRLGAIPSLAVADLEMVLEDWEGAHEWAVAEWRSYCDVGEKMAAPLKTFLYEEDAEVALEFFAPGSFVARWDENGPGSCWLPR